MANDPHPTGSKSSVSWPWALVTGLAVGFLVGREMGGRGGSTASDESPKAAAEAPKAGQAALPATVYKSESQFPAAWQKSADLTGHVAGVSFDGLSDAQKAIAMQALNERKCECGCGMESIAVCAKQDKTCPMSPKLTKEVVGMVKDGKTLADVL